MPQTWESAKVDNRLCENCGAEYEVTIHRIPQKDSDYFNCQICEHRMDEWRSTSYPSFKLVKK